VEELKVSEVMAYTSGPEADPSCYTGSRAPSSLSIRSRDSPVPKNKPPLSRTPSSATVTQSRQLAPTSPRQPKPQPVRLSSAGSIKNNSNTVNRHKHATDVPPSATSSPASSSSSSSSSSSEEEEDPRASRANPFRRPAKYAKGRSAPAHIDADSSGSDSDSDSEDSFLPFAQRDGAGPGERQDPSATLRDVGRRAESRQDAAGTGTTAAAAGAAGATAAAFSGARSKEAPRGKQPVRTDTGGDTTSDFDLSSPGGQSGPDVDADADADMDSTKLKGKGKGRAAVASESSPTSSSSSVPHLRGATAQRRLDALSPHHRKELARLGSPSPRRSGTARTAAEQSDGTPSMGSSFSDLDGESLLFFFFTLI
jgi:hypothetical protein